MSAGTVCLRCGSVRMIPAQLENPTSFCVDNHGHHGLVHVAMKAALCRHCGHVEFWVPDPSQFSREPEIIEPPVLQEEDF
jgi:hypothetical protein